MEVRSALPSLILALPHPASAPASSGADAGTRPGMAPKSQAKCGAGLVPAVRGRGRGRHRARAYVERRATPNHNLRSQIIKL